ncbi:hypothetical protein D3C73_1134480 [compost metagenome]
MSDGFDRGGDHAERQIRLGLQCALASLRCRHVLEAGLLNKFNCVRGSTTRHDQVADCELTFRIRDDPGNARWLNAYADAASASGGAGDIGDGLQINARNAATFRGQCLVVVRLRQLFADGLLLTRIVRGEAACQLLLDVLKAILQGQAILHQTIQNGFGLREDGAVLFDFLVCFLGESLDFLVALIKQIIHCFQLDLVVCMLLAVHLAVFGASLVAHGVMHGESSKRREG